MDYAKPPFTPDCSPLQNTHDSATEVLLKEARTANELPEQLRQFVRTSTLFLPGRYGWGASALAYGLTEIKPTDALPEQIADFALGALKSAGLRATNLSLATHNPALQGAGMGYAGRIIDTAL